MSLAGQVLRSVCNAGIVRPVFATGNLQNFQKIIQQNFGSGISSPYQHGRHRSNAQELIAKVPIVEVEGTLAICDGGGGGLGHPTEYIQLNTVDPTEPQVCKYCGTKFIQKKH
mmetsp:Transcript_14323/g.21064  ORF Transcript_14323/g.21064 Transcript_14323/m.21064 type:complete len:113 (+) Transcript_14323:70-408(+)|eukprot:CAMPEP_0113944124 /NCGR_PEP_ID=MMETSP1339-20121228/30651_1 /TAXON_ID=94617 /ORGANISM="Fibrocapsa japonica" /LENGTH=112 /DNA_ID=CAMNT_0000949199 /DNA_START=69 /DNA_END=407 /DNA_ORIENTATION=- /assembly_acc=CAM_ASM_000762